ncbi:MAG: DNA repair protein RadC [Candidatus Sumerlaeaceae bacterium]|nr:DNA repair protein RadC [Candidatus Sumerlaeaceae bacterium]
MKDLEVIECAEKVRRYCVEGSPRIAARLEELRALSFRGRPDVFFKSRLVALALGIDDSLPAGKRELRRALSRAEFAEHFSAEELTGLHAREAEEPYPAIAIAHSHDLYASLGYFSATVTPPGEDSAFSHKLEEFPNVHEAARYLRQVFPVLRGARAYEFLASVGYDAAVPENPTRRFLVRLGLLKNFAATNEGNRELVETIARVARLGGTSASEASLLFSLFSGARRDDDVEPLCLTKPKCSICPLRGICAHYASHGAPEPTARRKPIKEWSADDRPREKLIGGVKLSDSELLAIILRTGTGEKSALDLAREIIDRFGTLHRLLGASPMEIASEVRGIGPAKAAEIKAALELGRRAAEPEADDRAGDQPTVASSAELFARFRPRFQTETQEHFVMLALNTRNRVIREIDVSLGTLNMSLVHPRDAFKHAIKESAAAVIFLHNHPSGDPAPSAEDRALTRRLVESGKLLGIRVLDHVIIGAQRYYSFADEGELD